MDVPWTAPLDAGYAAQACNVDNDFGSFSELEYHMPAVGGATGRTRCDDVSQVWAFRGSRPRLVEVLARLTGCTADG
ncbi:MAG: hypothetical protein KIT09_28340 [Bryobacteraceae bacterium]|nr:hypothetical protein [Bryobacteraceae bacterium]